MLHFRIRQKCGCKKQYAHGKNGVDRTKKTSTNAAQTSRELKSLTKKRTNSFGLNLQTSNLALTLSNLTHYWTKVCEEALIEDLIDAKYNISVRKNAESKYTLDKKVSDASTPAVSITTISAGTDTASTTSIRSAASISAKNSSTDKRPSLYFSSEDKDEVSLHPISTEKFQKSTLASDAEVNNPIVETILPAKMVSDSEEKL